MQEEIEHKTVNFAISTAKLSARTLLRGAQFFLRQYDKSASQVLNAAFKEYSAAVLNKAERPSVLAKLHDLAQVIANLPDKVRHKEEERGL